MNIPFGILGAFVGVIVAFASPWSEVIMSQINSVLAYPSVSNSPGLAAPITVIGLICAYLLLPGVGFLIGSKS